MVVITIKTSLESARIFKQYKGFFMTTVTQEQLAAAKQFCHFLAWDNPQLAEQCFAAFEVSLAQDEPSFDLFDHLRMSVEPVCSFVDWNELDIMQEQLQSILHAHKIPVQLDSKPLNLKSSEKFFTGIQEMLCEHELELWIWDTGMSMYCSFITRREDDYQIDQAARKLGFHQGPHVMNGIAGYCC